LLRSSWCIGLARDSPARDSDPGPIQSGGTVTTDSDPAQQRPAPGCRGGPARPRPQPLRRRHRAIGLSGARARAAAATGMTVISQARAEIQAADSENCQWHSASAATSPGFKLPGRALAARSRWHHRRAAPAGPGHRASGRAGSRQTVRSESRCMSPTFKSSCLRVRVQVAAGPGDLKPQP
jgi:hypothetical protein